VPELDVYVVDVQEESHMAELLLHFWRTRCETGQEIAQGAAVLVEEDDAASEVREEDEDGHANGLQLLRSNVLYPALLGPESACFESAVEYGAPNIT
jgi:hypothetical protein